MVSTRSGAGFVPSWTGCEFFVLALPLILALVHQPTVATEPVDFGRDVRPILNRHCVGCYGGVKQASGLSFVYRDRVLGKGKSGKTIVVPGNLAASELIYRITTPDRDDRMPPVDAHPEGLTVQEIDTLKRWVAEGASWANHATLLHLLGFDHTKLNLRFQGLQQELTGVKPARVVEEVLV